MTRRSVSWLRPVFVAGLSAAVCLSSACRRESRARATSEYSDPHPLPAAVMVVDAPTLGKYGGRFVLGQTSNPRTFNAMMANESSSTDIDTRNLFAFLVDYDQGTQDFVPIIAKSWEVSADQLTWTFHLREG